MTNYTNIITVDGDEWKVEIDSEGVYLRELGKRGRKIMFSLEMRDRIDREYLGYLDKMRAEEKAIAAVIKEPANDCSYPLIIA